MLKGRDTKGELTTRELLRVAAGLAWCRPLVPYPGWCFDQDWNNPSLGFQLRRILWEHSCTQQLDEPLIMKWYHRIKFRCLLGNDTSKQLYVGGCIDPNEFALLDELLEPGMTFIDVGANEGLYSLFASRKVGEIGTVWAFEPSPRECGRLRANLELNDLENVEVFAMALGAEEGDAELSVAGFGHEGHNTLSSFVYDIELLEKAPVTLRRLDEVADQKSLRRVDVIKIDVEGAEVQVLQGASSVLTEMHPIIIVEAHDDALRTQGSSVDEMVSILRSSGYTIEGFDTQTGRLAQIEELQPGRNLVATPP